MALTKLPRGGIADSAITSAKVTDGVIQGSEFPDCSIASDRIVDCAVTNAKLANSAITIRGTSVSLGGSITISPDVTWQSKITSDGSTVTTMVAGNGYFVDNSSAAGLVKLPASASRGDTIIIKDYAGNFGTNNLTIQRNSHNIQGLAADSLLATNRKAVTLVYVDATQGWLYVNEHDVGDKQNDTYISATGGTVTTSGNDRIHTFTGDGCFVVASVGNATGGGDKVSYLVVAGGGSGAGAGGAGGGAGGFREGKDAPISTYTVSPLNAPAGLTVSASPGTYPVTVGGGAAGGDSHPGTNDEQRGKSGSNSVFSTITSAGGGGGGRQGDSGPNAKVDGIAGGSGGGAGQNSGPPPRGVVGAGNTPPVSPSQGNSGGQGNYAGNTPGSGGGGGAGATGGSAGGAGVAGNGGNGATTHITGSPVGYAGGGGATACAIHGVSADGGTGGTGGGGNASTGNGAGSAGTTNRGGGGGAGGSPGFCGGSSNAGGNGGSGIVVIRYKYQSG